MGDGLYISGVGVAMAFIVLILLMLATMGVVRVFRRRTMADSGSALATEQRIAPAVGSHEGAEASSAAYGPAATLDRTLSGVGVDLVLGAESVAEVAAIGLALAAHTTREGRAFGRQRVRIGDAEYWVEVSDPESPPVSIEVNGERCWGSLDGTGLPVGGANVFQARLRGTGVQAGRQWRSAQSIGQGGYWDRRGWSKRL